MRFLPRFPPSIPGPATEGIWGRAARDTDRIRAMWFARVVVALLDAGLAVFVAELLISTNKPGVSVGVLTAVAVVGGPFAAAAVVYVAQSIAAPFRQRNEARALVDTERQRAEGLEREQKTLAERVDAIEQNPKPALDQDEILRADLTLLKSEVVDARRAILKAFNDDIYWNEPLATNIWNAVGNKHLHARLFHRTHSDVSEAYAAIAEADDMRQMHEATSERVVMHELDRDELRQILDRVLKAENSLTDYLEGMDFPGI